MCGELLSCHCAPITQDNNSKAEDLGTSKKQRNKWCQLGALTHLICLEIFIPKSLDVWPVNTASYFFQHTCKILRHNCIHIKGHVLWLPEDSAGTKHTCIIWRLPVCSFGLCKLSTWVNLQSNSKVQFSVLKLQEIQEC